MTVEDIDGSIDMQSLLSTAVTKAIVVTGRGDRMLHWSKSVERIFDFSEAETVGFSLAAIIGLSTYESVHDTQVEPVAAARSRPFAGARTARVFTCSSPRPTRRPKLWCTS